MTVVNLEKEKLVLGITTSVLFDMSKPDACFKRYGREGYRAYMAERIDEPLPLNDGFGYAQNFSNRNNHEVVLLSRNDPVTAIRAVRTMVKHGIVPLAFAFTNGADPTRYLHAYGIDNLMTANKDDAEMAVARGFAASYVENPRHVDPVAISFKKANVTPIPTEHQRQSNVVVLGQNTPKIDLQEHHIFDFDGVVAGLSSEKIYQERGLDLYREFERSNLGRPLESGPYFKWLKKLTDNDDQYLTSICTIRGGWPAFRCLYDLTRKGIAINGEFHATAGRDKEAFLSVLKSSYPLPALFYDDREKYVKQAGRAGLLAGQVIHADDPKPSA